MTRCRVSHQWRRDHPPSQLQPQITSRHYSISNAPPISLADPGIPQQDGNAWAASSRAIHVHFHLHRPYQDCRRSLAAPSSYRPTPWPSIQRQNWNCFLDVAAAPRALGASAAYCRPTILLLQVTGSELTPECSVTDTLDLRRQLPASSSRSTECSTLQSTDGEVLQAEAVGISNASARPRQARHMHPDTAPRKLSGPSRRPSVALHPLRTW